MTVTLKLSALPQPAPVRWQPSVLPLTRGQNGQWSWRHSIFESQRITDSNCGAYGTDGRTASIEAIGQRVDLFV
jgi:hypothetical protein